MKTIETLTMAETTQLLEYLRINQSTKAKHYKSIRNYTIALLMLDAGLRVGEVVKLRQNDLIIAGEPVASILIREAISKNKQARTIPVSQRLRGMIFGMHKLWWSEDGISHGRMAFHNAHRITPLSVRQVQIIIKEAGRSAIGRNIHPHILRHTFATRLMRQTNIRVVQQLLGHKSISSTQIYTHPNSEDLTNAIKAISN